jgi:cell division protein ZapA
MSEENLKRIILTIAGRNYPVKVSKIEEPVMRSIEKGINDKLNDLQISYEGNDIRDYMSLALISYAFELHKAENSQEIEVLGNKLTEIEALLD